MPLSNVNKTIDLIDVEKIVKMIPHRYPMLLIDKVVDIVLDQSAIGIKNVTANENFFTGHFPSKMVMPGVLMIESMAQTCAVLVIETLGSKAEGSLVYFMSVDGGKFRKPVIPGDQLKLHVDKIKNRSNVWKFKCMGYVEDELVTEATISAMIIMADNK
jgi:3-hydroxyacyl-[acyl-carrier-protein] dehydratase